MTREEYIESRVYDEHEYIDVEEATKEWLDNIYSFKCVGGPFQFMSPSDVLFNYDNTSFREELNNYVDIMVRSYDWIEYDDNYWLPEAQKLIDDISDAIKDVDPFLVEDGEHRGWYYYDDMAMDRGPFTSPEDCYDHACRNQ